MVSMIAISSLASSSPCAPFLSHKLFWSKILSEQCHRSLSPPCPLGSERGLRSVCFFNAGDNSESKFQDKESGLEWPILRRWEVPWQWQTISITSLACGLGLTAAVVLGVLYSVASTYQPLSEDFFKYDWREPFNLQKGWLLWAGPGLAGALIAIGLTGAAMSFFSGETPKRETDVLVSFLPLIGSSNVSTACLVGITVVLAPLLEETVFRGFFLASLTKWVSTPVAVIVSAAVFALAHLTPGEFPQLFVLGTVLGISYAQTRNLLTPITIHAFWNSGVILLLTFLQLQGYDIKELLQTT